MTGNNSITIRTYSTYYADSDTESEGEAQFEAETGNEEQDSVATRLRQNQIYMDRQISSGNPAWILEHQNWLASEDLNVVLIRKPTASNLGHRLLNPFIYRNIGNVGTLNDLAELLRVPDDWEGRYNQIVQDGYLLQRMNDFRNLPEDTMESVIQAEFFCIVSSIALLLRILIRSRSETKIIVGGMLARYQYDLRSKTDPHFLNSDGLNLIASEAKTHITFSTGEMWYHNSRGIQVLSALYAFNSPTLLFTQKQWKLFVENPDRDSILTFPYGDNVEHSPHVNSSLVHPMGTTFLKVIAICLLSKREMPVEFTQATSIEESYQIAETPLKSTIKPKYFDTIEKPQRKSERLKKSNDERSHRKVPSFISGYMDGAPIYKNIRIASEQVVAAIEDEISQIEKKELAVIM